MSGQPRIDRAALRRGISIGAWLLSMLAGVASAQAATFQDFEGGGTPYVATESTPGTIMILPGGPGGSYLQLMPDYTGSLFNSIAFDKTDGMADTIIVEFDYRMSAEAGYTGGNRADGFSMALLSVDQFGSVGPAPVNPADGFVWELPRMPNAISLGFHIYNANRTLFYHNATLQSLKSDYPADLNTGVFNHVYLALTGLGTANPTASLDITFDQFGEFNPPAQLSAFTNLPLAPPGELYYPYHNGVRLAFGGRTGGEFVGLDLDNIAVDYIDPLPAPPPPGNSLSQNFDVPGTPYQQGRYFTNPQPLIRAADAGSTGNYIRVVNDTGSQHSEFAFDTVSISQNSYTLSFDYRMPTEDGHTGCCGQRADGFGFILLDANAHGPSGTVNVAPTVWERPGIANSISVGFDIFDGGDPNVQPDGNTVVLMLNGALVSSVQLDPVNVLQLNNGVFNQVTVQVDESGADSSLSLWITPDINGVPGSAIQVFDQALLSGISLDDIRVAFGARTGGAWHTLDLDNINLVGVPEPSSIVLLTLGALGAAVYARRRRGK